VPLVLAGLVGLAAIIALIYALWKWTRPNDEIAVDGDEHDETWFEDETQEYKEYWVED
jgi:hypothetical protein